MASAPDLVFTTESIFTLEDITDSVGSVFCVSGTPFDDLYFHPTLSENGKPVFQSFNNPNWKIRFVADGINNRWEIESDELGKLFQKEIILELER